MESFNFSSVIFPIRGAISVEIIYELFRRSYENQGWMFQIEVRMQLNGEGVIKRGRVVELSLIGRR